MRVKIYSHFRGETWEGDVPNDLLGDTDQQTNEQLFRLFNRVDQVDVDRLDEWGYRSPSLSAGDRVEYRGKVWSCEPVGWELVSTTKLDELSVKYERLTGYRQRLIRYYDQCPDGDRRKAEVLSKLDTLGKQITEVEKEQEKAYRWFESQEAGVKVARLLAPLPVGAEFRLSRHSTTRSKWVPNGYDALYRKNEQGTWDQVKGTCEPPHVINMSAEHLGFCVGLKPIEEALKGVAV